MYTVTEDKSLNQRLPTRCFNGEWLFSNGLVLPAPFIICTQVRVQTATVTRIQCVLSTCPATSNAIKDEWQLRRNRETRSFSAVWQLLVMQGPLLMFFSEGKER